MNECALKEDRALNRILKAGSLVCSGVMMACVIGCGIQNVKNAPIVSGPTSGAAVTGNVHGGKQPIYHARIDLLVTGNSGYGSSAQSLMGTNVVYTDAAGAFSISDDYTCPSADSMVYITATGGDPTGTATISNNNTALKFVAALGRCGDLTHSTHISMNELTTVAAAFALGQFFTSDYSATSTDSIGAPVSNQIGLVNAFATARNLVDTSTGNPAPTTPAPGTNFFMTSSDQLKLFTIGNVIASCVNQVDASSAMCTQLFSDVTPDHAPLSTSTSATVANDVFQAAVYMSLNPTSTNASGSHIADLHTNLQLPVAPFGPGLSAAPTDWTLALQYSGSGISYNSAVAIDSNGDVYLSNANASGGVAVLNGGSGVAGGTAGVTGGVIGFYSSTTNPSTSATVVPNGVRHLAIDTDNNAWFGGFSANASDNKSYLFRATSMGYTGVFPLQTGSVGPYAVAIEPSTNYAWFTSTSTGAYVINATAANGTTATTKSAFEGAASTTMAIDTNKNIFIPSGGANSIYQQTVSSGSTTAAAPGSPFSPGNLFTPYGAAIDHSNRLWMANNAVNGSAYSLAIFSGGTTTAITSACLQKPNFIAIDGNGNAWVTNNNATSGGIFTVCEFDSDGSLISSSSGFGPHGISTGRGIAVDLSGNVWVSNYTTSSTSAYVTQIVGAAVPAVSPIALAVKNNQVGMRP